MASHQTISAEKTRPANTTDYGANDVISESDTNGTGTAWTFTGPGRSGYIVGATVITDDASLTPSMTLFLFTKTPTGELDDNAANTSPVYATDVPVAAGAAGWIGHIDFDAMESLSATASWSLASLGSAGNLAIPYSTVATDALYGVLITRGAFTPSSGQKFAITLHVVRD